MKITKINILSISILILLIAASVFFACSNDESKPETHQDTLGKEIARFNGSSLEIINKSELKLEWEKDLKTQGYNVLLDNEFSLSIGDIENKGIESFILVAISKDRTLKTAFELIKEGDSYYRFNSSGTVTCTGCPSGCDPKRSGSNWVCTSCTSTHNNSCTKSVTVATLF